MDCGKELMLRRVRLSLRNKPIIVSSSKQLCIEYSSSYTEFSTKVEGSPLQTVLSFPRVVCVQKIM